jgi:hypothetical protein
MTQLLTSNELWSSTIFGRTISNYSPCYGTEAAEKDAKALYLDAKALYLDWQSGGRKVIPK